MIELDRLTKRINGRNVVESLSFSAPDGLVTGFLGPNGAGKTTSFRTLLGLAAATSGRATIDGVSYRELESPRQRVGAVLESTGFHPARTGRNHLRVVALGADVTDRRVDEVLEAVGLTHAAERRVGGYSLGMRQRLGIASALLGDPATLILDEPTNGLDPQGVAWLRELMRTWAVEGRCVIVASHLLAEVALAVDRIVIIKGGKLVAERTIEDLVDSKVTVRASDPPALCRALQAHGGRGEVLGAEEMLVTGLSTKAIGTIAARQQIPIYAMRQTQATEVLEELFLAATNENEAP